MLFLKFLCSKVTYSNILRLKYSSFTSK